MNEILTLKSFYNQIIQNGFEAVYKRLYDLANHTKARSVWITLSKWEDLIPRIKMAQELFDREPWIWEIKPLFGVPCSIKDNIDVLGFPTTAACPAYLYYPKKDAKCISLLREAGAIVIGKTNMDQFATGLVGLRSPYGYPLNSWNNDFIPGGSSSGSAVSVSLGIVCFSLGTDTAGSGRVPASLNNIYGIKPTPGFISTTGVVPACRSLDCVSIFTNEIEDAKVILDILVKKDADDPFSHDIKDFPIQDQLMPDIVFIPLDHQLNWFGDDNEVSFLWENALKKWIDLGVSVKKIDFNPFLETAKLLYQGPWIAERAAFIEDFLIGHEKDIIPVTKEILEKGLKIKGTEVFKAEWKLKELRKKIDSILLPGKAFLTPTIGKPFTIDEVLNSPIDRNNDLGYYTNFMNLAGLSAVSYPDGFYKNGMPFGLTLFTSGGGDYNLLKWIDKIKNQFMLIYVCGAHMRGLSLNNQLTSRDAVFFKETKTAPIYKLYLITNPPVERPALIRVKDGGVSISGELWFLPIKNCGSFLQNIPSPLGLGKVLLETGNDVTGFLGENWAIEGMKDISKYGGWRSWLSVREL